MKPLIAACILAAATPASADDLARLEAATEASARQMNSFFVSRAPELKPTVPNEQWDATFREAGKCFLNVLHQRTGSKGVATYLAALEGWAATPITSMKQFESMPRVLINDNAQVAARKCRTIELGVQRMQQSGMLQLMQSPAVIEKLKD